MISMRGLVDHDVASLYGGKTKEVNQTVQNNPDRFSATKFDLKK